MNVRRAGPADLEAVAELFDAYRQFYRYPPDRERARTFIAARLSRGDSVIFLAEEGDRALGFTQLYPGLSSLSTAPIWLLNDLYVAPAGRGHGAGRALVERARRHAEETGAAGLELLTERGNAAAQRLYERLGWRRGDFVPYSLSLGPAS
ncbi:MAG TPA: GNAT family N-acetyltransferase [Gemmatimonadales bacterium]|nr:GNAT family N-acetyltransferase [Gemmatimonadales bacterium]